MYNLRATFAIFTLTIPARALANVPCRSHIAHDLSKYPNLMATALPGRAFILVGVECSMRPAARD
jgi:hypothetical protein